METACEEEGEEREAAGDLRRTLEQAEKSAKGQEAGQMRPFEHRDARSPVTEIQSSGAPTSFPRLNPIAADRVLSAPRTCPGARAPVDCEPR